MKKHKKLVMVITGIAVAVVLGILFVPGLISPNMNGRDDLPAAGTGISPRVAQIDNFQLGQTATWTLTIRNGNNHEAEFSANYRVPDHGSVEAPFVSAGSKAINWVRIPDGGRFTLQADETRNITITIRTPDDAVAPAKQWEFWLEVTDMSQTGNVMETHTQRVLVTMGE